MEEHVLSYIFETCSPNPWDFPRGKSTTGVLLAATHAWHLALDRGNDICCVFLDLSKAFDKVPHITLLDTLPDVGINPHVLNWLQDYLCQRSQYVVVNGECSTTSNFIFGVPQGSVDTESFALCHLYGWNYTASFPGGITLIVVYIIMQMIY